MYSWILQLLGVSDVIWRRTRASLNKTGAHEHLAWSVFYGRNLNCNGASKAAVTPFAEIWAG
jgi:hypothetical protein